MKAIAWFGVAALAVSSACWSGSDDVSRINSSISVDSNQEAGDLSDVNGAVRIGDHCSVHEVSTVNGDIDIGSNSKAHSLQTVNGAVSIGSGTRVSGDATTVNGRMSLDRSAEVAGSLTNVNGEIVLTAAHVGDGITTVWGDIEIGRDSRVEHGIVVKKSSGWSSNNKHPPTIVIGPGVTVTGTMRFEHEVKLYVSDKATIGVVEGAKAMLYSGDRP